MAGPPRVKRPRKSGKTHRGACRGALRRGPPLVPPAPHASGSLGTRGLGACGEQLFYEGLAQTGFRIIKRKVKEVSGVVWTETGHDLDRLIVRDDVPYGVEIKNQLGYIGLEELEAKLRMCERFGVRPMFVARMMPKSYINDVVKPGGFCLSLKQQNYPLLAEDLAKRVRERLGLPVACIRELPDTTMNRFVTWHEKKLAGTTKPA